MLRSSYTLRTKCAISDAFVRDCVFAYCASVAQYVYYLSAKPCFRLRTSAISDERVRDCALCTHSVCRPLTQQHTPNPCLNMTRASQPEPVTTTTGESHVWRLFRASCHHRHSAILTLPLRRHQSLSLPSHSAGTRRFPAPPSRRPPEDTATGPTERRARACAGLWRRSPVLRSAPGGARRADQCHRSPTERLLGSR